MKTLLKIFLTIGAAFLVSCTTSAEDENDDFDAAKVCPVSGRGTFTDERDGQVYKYTTIGNQVWMAENLRYDAEYSVCLNEYITSDKKRIDGFCEKYGRFYSLQMNGMYLEKIDTSLIKNVCPKGWHLPFVDEWKNMVSLVGSKDLEIISKRLRIDDYWFFWGNGTDDCGISIRPAGAYMGEKSNLSYFGYDAIFWTSTVDSLGEIKTIKIANDVVVFNNLPKMSIRCVKD